MTGLWASADGRVSLHRGECLEFMRSMPPDSVDLIATDPPYFKVKGEAWDRQWDNPDQFIAWIGQLCEEWHRILKPSGSLYVFASPKMAARVECEIGKRFAVLNHLVWSKPTWGYSHTPGRASKEALRLFFPWSERIIFAEHYGSDNIAKGEAGYGAKCDELRGFVFEPLLRYLSGEFEASALSRREVDEHFCTANVSQYWLQPRGFIIPTAEKYAGLQALRPSHFRREYDDLRREYDDLRRPFSVTADVPYTDVWTFPTVQAYKGKHPCEKPLAMMEHIVTASSRPDAVVLDCFAGSGVTGEACIRTGRRFIGVEMDETYHASASARLARCMDETPCEDEQPSLFAEATA